MVNDEVSWELEIGIANEAIAPRQTVNHLGIFEPPEICLLPRKLELDVRNGEPGCLRSHDELDLKPGAGTPVERGAFDDPPCLAHPQGVGRNAANLAVILGNVDGTAGAPNSTRLGQLIKSFSLVFSSI